MSSIKNAQLSNLYDRVANCKDCEQFGLVNIRYGLRGNEPWRLRWYDDFKSADGKLIIVGMDFGNEEMVKHQHQEALKDNHYRPSYRDDRSYVRLRKFLLDEKVNLGEVAYLTNAVLCVRKGNSNVVGPMSSAVYHNCQKFLIDLINIIEPQVIATLGATVLKWVAYALKKDLANKSITKILGNRLTTIWNTRKIDIFPLLHPAMGQKNWTDEMQIKKLYRRLREIYFGQDMEPFH